MADLHLVEEAAAGLAGDDALEGAAIEFRVERVVDFVRGEVDAAETVDGNRVGQLELVGLEGSIVR